MAKPPAILSTNPENSIVCVGPSVKGWRNKQWRGRMMAFIELLSGEFAYILLPLGEEAHVKLEAVREFSSHHPSAPFFPTNLAMSRKRRT